MNPIPEVKFTPAKVRCQHFCSPVHPPTNRRHRTRGRVGSEWVASAGRVETAARGQCSSRWHTLHFGQRQQPRAKDWAL